MSFDLTPPRPDEPPPGDASSAPPPRAGPPVTSSPREHSAAPPPDLPPAPRPSDVRVTHRGHRYALGVAQGEYALWDAVAQGAPLRRWPQTPTGWSEAWSEYARLEGPTAFAPAHVVPAVVQQGNGLAVAGLVLGIIGVVFGFIPLTAFIALICGVLALVFGGIGRGRPVNRGMATAGMVLGGVAVVLAIVGFVILAGVFGRFGEFGTARARAQDRAAQSDLRNALVAAKVYFTDDDTYTGFDAGAGGAIEPTIAWVVGPGAPPGDDAVGIAHASSGIVVLNADSDSGKTFCIADDASGRGTVRGLGTASSYEACAALEDW